MTRFNNIVMVLAVSLMAPAFANAQNTPPNYGLPIKLAVACFD